MAGRKFCSLGARLFTVAYERGLLRSVADRRMLVFTQPMIQSYLAAEAWAKRSDWLEELPRVKSQPPWSDVVIFMAAGLAHARRLPELALLLQGVCDPLGGDAADLNWLLAAQCLAELDEDTQQRVVRTHIGEQIRQRLVAWLNHPGTSRSRCGCGIYCRACTSCWTTSRRLPEGVRLRPGHVIKPCRSWVKWTGYEPARY